MLKVLAALIAILFPLSAYSGPVEKRGEWQPFKKEIVFEADVVEMEEALGYWVRPKEPDIVQTKTMIEDMHTPNMIRSPFVFKIQLAGLSSGVESGMLLSEDGFETEAIKASRAELIDHQYQFRCYGKYSDLAMPVCSAIDAKGQSAGVSLVRKGIFMRDKNFKGLSSLESDMMKDAEKSAEADAIGIWKPFRFMFRGLQ